MRQDRHSRRITDGITPALSYLKRDHKDSLVVQIAAQEGYSAALPIRLSPFPDSLIAAHHLLVSITAIGLCDCRLRI